MLAAALFTLAIHRVDGTSIPPSTVAPKVKSLMKAAEVTGAGIAILSHGRVAYMHGFGFRDVEKKLPLTPDSVMSGASFSKAAFAYLCMRLVDQRRLDLDKPIAEYLPAVPAEYAAIANDPRFRRITARTLLSHTSGLPNWRSLESDRKLKIHFDPGTHYAYSGEGIDLLQRVVETITGEPLETLMQREVFRPLGMKRTSMIWQAPFGSDFANGYDEYSRSLGPQRRKRADAAGSLQTTLRDFTRFVQAVLAGEGLSKRAHAEMLSPQIRILSRHEFPTFEPQMTDINQRIRLSYGLGWGLYWTPYGKAFFKEGHDDGWRNYVVAFERSGDGIVIMTNSGNGEGIFEDLLETLLGNRYTPIEWERFTPYDQLPPRAPLPVHTRVSIDPALLEKCAGVYAIGPNKLVMRRSGDHLTVQENDEPMQELLPQSATEFFSTVADDVYRFETGPDGRVTRVVLITGDEQIPIPRTP